MSLPFFVFAQHGKIESFGQVLSEQPPLRVVGPYGPEAGCDPKGHDSYL